MTFNRWLDFLYPPSCQLCRTPLREGRSLCQPCSRKLPRISAPYCDRCGLPFDGNITTTFTCPNCQDHEPSYDYALAALRARDGARDLIHAFKYQRRLHLFREIGLLLAETIRNSDDERVVLTDHSSWAIVPVPLHRRRQYWRWFNQAEEIARVLSEELSVPLVLALKRTRDTRQQILLSRKDRQKNLRGAFRLKSKEKKKPRITQKNVLLIDDVFTTGSTAEECARVLKADGRAEKVVVLTVLRG